jgi:PAS domain S-box-containing protein
MNRLVLCRILLFMNLHANTRQNADHLYMESYLPMKNTIRSPKWLWINHRAVIAVVFVLVSGALFAYWNVHYADRAMRAKLLFQVRLVAKAMRLERIRALSGTKADKASPNYLDLKEQLALTKMVYQECRFIYLMGRREDGTVFFFVDSEPVGSENESAAGQIYEEISDEDMLVFDNKTAGTTGPSTDRWGTWVSGLVPLTAPGTGDLVAVLGMDFPADNWKRKLIEASRPQIQFTLMMAAVLAISSVLFILRLRAIGQFSPLLRYMENTLLVTAVGVFLSVSIANLSHDIEANARIRAFEQMAADKTAAIAKTFDTLHDTELEALARFYEASEYVSLTEFSDYTDYLLKNRAVLSWKWVQAVPAGKKEAVLAKVHSEGLAGFTIWQKNTYGERIPAVEKEMYYPVLRIAPLEGNETALGYDIGSESNSRVSFEEAIHTRLPTCIYPPPISSKADSDKILSVCRPVFSKGKLLGFAVADLHIGKVLSNVQPVDSATLELSIGRSGNIIELLASSMEYDGSKPVGLSETRPIFIFGKAFFVTAHAGPAFMHLYPTRIGGLVILAGLLLTTSLAIQTGVIYRKRMQLETLVAERTTELVEARHRAELAIDGADLGTWDWDIPANTVTFNENWAKMMGYKKYEITHRIDAWRKMISYDDLSEVSKVTGMHLDGKTDFYETEHRMQHRSGEWKWVLAKGRALKWDTNGRPLRICGTYLDITRRKQIEKTLRESQVLLRTLIDTLPDLVWLKDPEGVYMTCNKRFERFFGAKESEIIDKTDYDFVEKELADFFREKDKAAMTAGKPSLNEEAITYADDGTKALLETIKTPMYDSSGQIIGVLGIARDITERKRAEEEREKLRDQLVQAQKLEAVGVLAGGVAHDFNNMLGAIIGYAELAMDGMDTAAPVRRNLDKILDAAQRSADLTRQLLAFARKQTVTPVVLDLNESVETMLKMLRRLIGEDIDLAWLPGKGQHTISIDPSQLDQVLANLCVNARDAIKDVGRVIIETGKASFDETSCDAFPDAVPGDFVMLAVSDNGCGIDEETKAHIFEPFFTTKSLGKGTGLGLSTVYGIVKQNEGFIHVDSRSGKGTTFKIFFPSQPAAGIAQKTSAADDIPRSRGETVLLVEDDTIMREMGQIMLQRLGYAVLSAATPGEAIQLATDNSENFQVLITDVVMPEMNGRELAERLLAISPNIKHLFMSGYTPDIIIHRGVLDEGINFIQKPFSLKDLAVKIRTVLDQT